MNRSIAMLQSIEEPVGEVKQWFIQSAHNLQYTLFLQSVLSGVASGIEHATSLLLL